MTVPVQTPIIAYTGNGIATVFTTPFRIILEADLTVEVAGVVMTSGFTIVGLGDDEGTITFTTPPAAGAQILMYRQVALERDIDYQNNGDFTSSTVNADFDRIWMALQDVGDKGTRAIHYPVEEIGTDGTLPIAAVRASNVLGFDDTGKQTMVPIGSQLGAGDLRFDTFPAGISFTPDVTTQLTLSRAPISKGNCWVYWDGTPQLDFTLSGNTLIFPTPIPTGISNVYVRIGTTLSLNTPAQGSVTDDSIAPGTALYDIVFSNLRKYGAKCDGVTDDSAAFATALAFLQSHGGGSLYVPGHTILNGDFAYTFAGAADSLRIWGPGPEIAKLDWHSAGGITFNYLGAFNSVQMVDLSLVTKTTGGSTAVKLVQTSAGISDPGNSALNIFQNVLLHGSSGFGAGHVDYWGNGIVVRGVSNINFTNVQITGPTITPYSTLGVGIDIAGTAALIPVVYNLVGCTFNLLNLGIVYGAFLQGFTCTNSNFTGCAIGIAVPAGITGLVQMIVTNSQFNCSTALNVLSEVVGIQFNNNLLLIPNPGSGLIINPSHTNTICNNIFTPAAFGGVENGIVIGVTAATSGSMITGNIFWFMGSAAIDLLAGSQNVSVQSNKYLNCAANVVDNGTGNTIGGGTP